MHVLGKLQPPAGLHKVKAGDSTHGLRPVADAQWTTDILRSLDGHIHQAWVRAVCFHRKLVHGEANHRRAGPIFGLRLCRVGALPAQPGEELRGVADIDLVGDPDEHRQKEEGGDRLPNLNNVWRPHCQNERQPEVCEDRDGGRNVEGRQLPDLPCLRGGDDRHADGHNDQQVEGGRAGDRLRPEGCEVELLLEQVHDREGNLWCR
mmetsp:Transcript_2646/g.8526  ORF Transcript_2646/g.8526 Transcript_2646/m.8526 type:complete len:206 (+) Transcript_2646:885-1502(+)